MPLRLLQAWMVCAMMLALGNGDPSRGAPVDPPAVQLVSVRSTKVLYGAREPITGEVAVKNSTKSLQQVTVRAWLEWEMDQRGAPRTAQLSVPPEGTAV